MGARRRAGRAGKGRENWSEAEQRGDRMAAALTPEVEPVGSDTCESTDRLAHELARRRQWPPIGAEVLGVVGTLLIGQVVEAAPAYCSIKETVRDPA